MLETIVEERVQFAVGELTLSGVLGYPWGARPSCAVLLCSPHPHFAGDMANNVILALGRHLSAEAVTLRFDYRGVGQSEIRLPDGASVFDYWHAVEERHAYDDAMADVTAAAAELAEAAGELPTVAVGYSFGAVMSTRLAGADSAVAAAVGISPPLTRVSFDHVADLGRPCLLLCCEGDFVYDADAMSRLAGRAGANLQAEVLPEGDHFFRGEEEVVCSAVGRFIRDAMHFCEDSP